MRIRCQHLRKSFQTTNGSVNALEDTNFSVEENEFVCVVGPSGCGKTTLLKIIAGLIEPTKGTISFEPNSSSSAGRPLNALVFQEQGLFPWMTVLDNVGLGLEMRGMKRRDRRARAKDFIEKFGLGAFSNSYPHELSLGMRQRVGIARAFAVCPHMLLMDEPFGSLDAQTKLVLQDELLKIWREYQSLVLYITHDIEEAILLADRVLVMSGRPGHIREEITIPLDRPRNLVNGEHPVVREIKWHIWRILQDEVRRSLCIYPS